MLCIIHRRIIGVKLVLLRTICEDKDTSGPYTRVGTLIVATIYLQLIQNRYMF